MESHTTQLVMRFVFEVALILGMSVGQVFLLRRLFNKRSARAGP